MMNDEGGIMKDEGRMMNDESLSDSSFIIHHSSFITHHSSPIIHHSSLMGIPASLRPCFQEYDFEQLNPAQHADLIIERTLAYGNRIELRWLFNQYGRPRLVEWVQRLGSRRLPWRRYNLWCVLLGLPPARRLRPEGARIWPY